MPHKITYQLTIAEKRSYSSLALSKVQKNTVT